MSKKVKVAILISGRGSNMKALIEACKNKDFPAEIVLVLSNKKDALGLEFAKSKNIATEIIEHKNFNSRENFDKELDKIISSYKVEIICLAGFMRLLSPWFTKKWHDKLINIHPSFLPHFKGANAVEDAINAKAKFSGCTVHYVRAEMDSGPIIKQVKVDILPSDTKEELATKILEQEHKIYSEALKIVALNYLQN